MTPDHLGPADDPDRFTLVRRLGGGSMGVVYEAHDRVTGGRVALKTLVHGDARHLPELKREFRLVESVVHPNLVRLGDLFQGADTWFFTMELLDGSDYVTWVRGNDTCIAETDSATGSTTAPPSRPVVVAAPLRPAAGGMLERLGHTLPQLGRALMALHSAGLVHRDIKPSNVMVTTEERVVVLDFGLVRAAGDELHGSSLAGTLPYMAPEQAVAGPVTSAADCYAVGVMLYQALTGRLPFVGAFEDLIQHKRIGAPISPGRLAQGLPADLESLCLRLLDPDPAARPTAAEIAAWPGGPVPRADQPASAPAEVFVGRARELEQIRDAFDGVRPVVVVIDGESGIGKTALLREATRQLTGERSLVLHGRCFEREVIAYAGVDPIMDALVDHLRRQDRVDYFVPRNVAALRQIFPVLGKLPAFIEPEARPSAVRGHEMRLRAAGSFHDLFARVATRHEVVVSIDDAQWLTEASLVLLRRLLAADDPVPLVLLLAARGPDLGRLAPWLDALTCQKSRVPLGPLLPAESLELLRHHLAGRDAPDLQTMADDSAGHPYLLRELALAIDDRVPSGQTGVDEVLRDRAARLAPLERAVLDLVCAAASPIDRSVVGAAAGIEPGTLDALVAVLVRQHWVTPPHGGGSIRPAHDRVRAALRAALDEPARRELARRLAEAIEVEDRADVESLALQWRRAGDLSRAAPFARLAGDRAMEKLAFEGAADLYDLALQGASRDVDRTAALTAMADALAAAGRGGEAAAAYLRAAELVGGSAADDLVLRAADQLIRSGQVAAGKQQLTRVLGPLGIRMPRSSSSAVLMVLARRLALHVRGQAPRALSGEERRGVIRRIDACWVAGDLLALLDPLRAMALHLQGMSLARDLGEPEPLARSLCMHAALAAQPGARKRRLAFGHLAAAEQLCKQVGSPRLDGYVAMNTGIVELLVGEFDDAQRDLDRAEAIFERCPGTYWEIGFARSFALWTLAYRGRLPELAQRLTAAVALCTARGDRLGVFNLQAGPSRVILLARDEPHALLEACRTGPLGLDPGEHSFLALCALFGRVNAFLYLGRAADALAALDAARGEIQDARILYCQFHRIELAYLRGRVALARMSECSAAEHAPLVAMTRASVRALRRERVAWASAFAATLEGSLALRTASREQAIADLREGAVQLAAVGLGGFANAVQWQLEHVLGQRGRAGDPWHGGTVVRPDRLAHTLAPLPIY